jgi:hypothetical protein
MAINIGNSGADWQTGIRSGVCLGARWRRHSNSRPPVQFAPAGANRASRYRTPLQQLLRAHRLSSDDPVPGSHHPKGLICIPHLGVLRVTDSVETGGFGAAATDKQCVPRASRYRTPLQQLLRAHSLSSDDPVPGSHYSKGLICIPHLGVLRVTDTVDTDAFGAAATDKQCVPRARLAIT